MSVTDPEQDESENKLYGNAVIDYQSKEITEAAREELPPSKKQTLSHGSFLRSADRHQQTTEYSSQHCQARIDGIRNQSDQHPSLSRAALVSAAKTPVLGNRPVRGKLGQRAPSAAPCN